MNRSKKIFLSLSLILCVGLLIFAFNTYQGKAVNKELTEEELASLKVKELNGKVASGEEFILDDSATFPYLSEEELYTQADLIVMGHVKKKVKEYKIHNDIPFSEFEFQVKEYIKSTEEYNDTNTNIIITQDGNSETPFDKHPLLNEKGQYVLFLKVLKENNDVKLIMVGGPNGKFDVENGKVNQLGNLNKANGQNIDQFLQSVKEKKSKY